MFKFIKGDMVLVSRRTTLEEEEKGWGDTWVPGMDNTIGKECEILYVSSDQISLGGDGNGWNFPPFVLVRPVRVNEQMLLWGDL